MSRVLVAMSAAGAAVIHAAASVSTVDGGVGAVLAVVGAAELTIAVGTAISARWLPGPRTVALLLVGPVLLWAAALLVAVTADTPALASALVTAPLAGASLLGLAGAALAGADARRTRLNANARSARVHPARVALTLQAAALLTALVVVPSVAATIPTPAAAVTVNPAAPTAPTGTTTIEFQDHSEHGAPAGLGD